MNGKVNLPPAQKSGLKQIFQSLGPGLISGAADDDPSGIATYSQAGAQFGYSMLWTAFFTYPFMVAIQIISARIGRVTGKGIIANVKQFYPAWLVYLLVGLLITANTINIAADLLAMGDALRLVIGGSALLYGICFGLLCLCLEVFIPYRRYARILKFLTMVLFVYIITAFTVNIPWGQALAAAVLPSFTINSDSILLVVAIFGTTISPYLFFWQASQEVEDMYRNEEAKPLKDTPNDGSLELSRISLDTSVGMAFSNIIAFFIILVTASTLHASGINSIQTSAQAAEALRPLAGNLTFFLFAGGIIGTGLLAVPVLAGSAAYGAAEAVGWNATLEAKPMQAKGFYGIVALATLTGIALDFTSIDPIKMLFWSAVINGFVSVPIMAIMMLVSSNPDVMGRFTLHRNLRSVGWIATLIMGFVVFSLLYYWMN